jgi:hypothetical protein
LLSDCDIFLELALDFLIRLNLLLSFHFVLHQFAESHLAKAVVFRLRQNVLRAATAVDSNLLFGHQFLEIAFQQLVTIMASYGWGFLPPTATAFSAHLFV